MGIGDDLFDIRWRHKFFIPAFASIPLLVVYFVDFGVTSIVMPIPLQPYLGELFDLGQFPGTRRTRSDGRHVQGELYRLPRISKALLVLDKIEGFCTDSPDSSLFVRKTTEVSLPNGERVSAWVYWLHRWKGPMRRIPSGDYRRG